MISFPLKIRANAKPEEYKKKKKKKKKEEKKTVK
jgi:hypothetical protein